MAEQARCNAMHNDIMRAVNLQVLSVSLTASFDCASRLSDYFLNCAHLTGAKRQSNELLYSLLSIQLCIRKQVDEVICEYFRNLITLQRNLGKLKTIFRFHIWFKRNI